MFTGLIQQVGSITATRRTPGGLVVSLSLPDTFNDLELGESIAVDGACLTVTACTASRFDVDVSSETVARTTLARRAAGSQVNLERAMRPMDRLGGHMVTGHVDCVATVASVDRKGEFVNLSFSLPPGYSRHVVEKGSVAVDGVSLTIASCNGDGFLVSVIPLTLSSTTLGRCRVGDEVNIETDIIAKYVEKLLGASGDLPSVEGKGEKLLDKLKDHGFLG